MCWQTCFCSFLIVGSTPGDNKLQSKSFLLLYLLQICSCIQVSCYLSDDKCFSLNLHVLLNFYHRLKRQKKHVFTVHCSMFNVCMYVCMYVDFFVLLSMLTYILPIINTIIR